MNQFKNKTLPFFMWLFPLFFFAYQFIFRLWPGLMMPQIMSQFSIDAGGFGLLAAVYYYGYAGMQIPMAILLDKFGPRRVISAFVILCGCAMLVFTQTHHFYVALLSRFLIGVGSAAGFLGVSKVVSEWFDHSDYGKMIGFSFTFGLLGAIYGGKPISILIATYSWQSVAWMLSLVSLGLGCVILAMFRSPKKADVIKNTPINLRDISTLLTSWPLWGLAVSNFLMVGSLEGFSDAWGIPYLMSSYGFDKANAALLVSFIFFGMIFGGPILAVLSKKFGNYRMIFVAGTGIALLFTVLLVKTTENWWLLSSLFFLIGILSCYQVVVFAAGASLVPARQLGITIAFLNGINMLGGSFFHTFIGKLMVLFWDGQLDANGIKIYHQTAYEHALILIPVGALVGAILVYFMGRRINKQHLRLKYYAS